MIKKKFESVLLSNELLFFALGALASMVLFLKDPNSSLYELAKEWQTLISGFIALLAALITVRTIKQQIATEEIRHKEERERRAFAIRARIPSALSELSTYIESCFRGVFLADKTIIKSAPNVTDIFSDHVEFCDEETAKNIYRIICEYQILNSRIQSHFSGGFAHIPKESRLCDCLKFHHMTLKMFDYARNEEKTFLLNELNMENKKDIAHIIRLTDKATYHLYAADYTKLAETLHREHTKQ